MKHARGKDDRRIVSRTVSERKRRTETGAGRTGRISANTSGRTAVSGVSKKSKKKNRSRIWKRILPVLLICLLVITVVVLSVGAGMYASVAKEIDELDFEGIAYNFTSVVYATDKDGNAVEVEYLHNDGNREWIDSDKIPDVARDAAVAIEDERFYKHEGIDLKRTTGAVFGWVGAKITGGEPSYGGSTITQQVIKNLTQEKDKTVTRKVKEMMRAIAFEKRFTKEEILSTYLNISYFGNQCYGIEAASKMYFSKPAAELEVQEAAMIVGITQAPTRFDPFRNPDNAKTKRDLVLKKMYELKKIDKEAYEKAVATPLGVNDSKRAIRGTIYSYFIDQVISDVIADLQEEKGYSQSFATSQVFGGGLKIYTTMDSSVQAAVESVYEDASNFPGAGNGIQSAIVIMDPENGQIKGMAGGVGTKNESRGLNRATQSRRQPGSSIKPISVYGPALEKGKITAATIITDSPLTIKEKDNWTPTNSYSGFKGDMSVRKAIEISANIPAVKTLQTLGVDKSYEFMTKDLGFTSLTGADRDLSPLSLGGLTKGVSPKEMAAAYAVFANKGMYTEPYTYTKVVDKTGKVVLENNPKPKRVMSEANAYIMTSFLKDVVNGSAGTGARARLSRVTAYGKTGTSNDNKDKWFCGYTPYYVGAAWYGYDNNKPVGSSNIAATVWKKVMDKIHADIPNDGLIKNIEKPDSVTAVSVCQLTGKLTSSGCGHGKTEYFAKGTIPSNYCGNNHANVIGATTGEEEEDPTAVPEGEDPTITLDPSESPAPSAEPSQAPSSTPNPKPTKNPEVTKSPEDDVITLE